jgi:L-threonylcarbamoyladenylate synthase
MTRCLSVLLLRRIKAHVARGGIIAYATEFCFGFGCNPRNHRAVTRLLALKRRPRKKGLIVIADGYDQLRPYLAPLNATDLARAQEKWPGPHTWLLPASRLVSRAVRGRHGAIAVRVTAHEGARRLCRAIGQALISTSANVGGRMPARIYRDCVRQFGGRTLVVPGRVGTRRHPSTVQDFRSGRILR